MRTKSLLQSALFAKQGENYTKVALPHTWNAYDGQDGGNDYFRGLGTYMIELPNPTEGKKQYIEFQGANHIATVYCNGRKLGTHKGGFSTFRYELTKAMKKEGNQLMVVVTNGVSDIYPQNADFTFYGGLYRDVLFVEVNEAHFDLLKHGTEAVFVTPYASGKTRVDLFTVNANGCEIAVTCKDAEGKIVAEGEVVLEGKTGGTSHAVIKMNVKQPKLWNSIDNPYCYTCEAMILKDGEEMDKVEVTYGYRSFHVDPERGFFLNGKSYPLHGVSRHQDKLDKGWAISKEDHELDATLIKEIGANSIRLAHYQHDQYFYDICDREGFVLWAEIPFISQFIPGQEAYENTISQMTELIAQNYNHPSIFFWGISNEITITGESEELYRNLTELQALSKRLDPSRLTTMAQVSMVPMDSEHVYITDILGYNHYFGWYVGEVEDNGPWLDKFHALNPDRALGISEYGVENILKWHSCEPENHDYTEEYASYYHHEMLKTFATRPYLWSTYVWNMFDFAADARDEGGIKGRNNKGLVTYDRQTKKDAFYIYQAYWTKEPMLHIAGRRFADRAKEERTITVYTNCEEVTLLVNEKEVSTRKPVDHAVMFENVELREGRNIVTVKAGTLEDTIVLNGVSEHNYAYDLPEGNEAANWFDDKDAIAAHKARKLNYPKGYYSLKDKISTLMQHPQTEAIVQEVMKKIMGSGAMSMVSFEDGMGKEMMDFMGMMTLANLLKMSGDALNADEKYELNERLNKIKK